MPTLGLFNLAALVASLMVLAIAAVLIPDKSWSVTAITSAIVFSMTVGLVFYLPSIVVKKQSGNDAARMAALGPLGGLTGCALLLTAGGFALALLGMDRVVAVLDIFAVGSLAISGLMLRAATNVIGDVVAKHSVPSKHIAWQAAIQGLHHIATDTLSKAALVQLAEKFRYAASDVSGGSPQDILIDEAVQYIGNQLGADSAADVQSHISKIEILLAQRDLFLMKARSKI
ncbi:MAG: hypothetical protein ABL912_14630 [Novosphingobium sp.]